MVHNFLRHIHLDTFILKPKTLTHLYMFSAEIKVISSA